MNGWKNYPTWAVNLWADEYGADTRNALIVASCDGPSALREAVEDQMIQSSIHALGADLIGWALDSVAWDELVAHYSPVKYARDLGTEHGTNAASWTYGASDDWYRETLQGLADGDPAILDRVPAPDLSGQWADSLTGPQLVTEALDSVGWAGPDDETSELFSAICEAYEQAFDDAAYRETERIARSRVEAAS